MERIEGERKIECNSSERNVINNNNNNNNNCYYNSDCNNNNNDNNKMIITQRLLIANGSGEKTRGTRMCGVKSEVASGRTWNCDGSGGGDRKSVV